MPVGLGGRRYLPDQAGRRSGRRLDGMVLRTDAWKIEPATVHSVRSSFFDDPDHFPPGSATLDCALLMRDVPADWHPLPAMPVTATAA